MQKPQDLNDSDIERLLQLSAEIDAALEMTASTDPDVEGVVKPKKKAAAKPKQKLSEPNIKKPEGTRGWSPARYELVLEAQTSAIDGLVKDMQYLTNTLAAAFGIEPHIMRGIIDKRELTFQEEVTYE